jgi:hypothetical protein
MYGAVPLLPLYAFMAWTEKTPPFLQTALILQPNEVPYE